MSFNIVDSTKIDNSIIATYNYNNSSIYLNQVIHSLQQDGYVQVPLLSTGSPNVIINSAQYKTCNLYITPSHSLIQGIAYEAELVIEHLPNTNDSSSKLYTCFLLQHNSSEPITSIDKLINLDSQDKGPVNISLDTRCKQIYYTDLNSNQVIIFTTPIKINSQVSTPTTPTTKTLFSTNISKYSILNPTTGNIVSEPSPIIEGLTQTAYCQPIDMVDSSGAEDANLTIPLSGLYTPNDATNSVTRTAINFMAFVLVLGFTYLLAPIIYNDYIIGIIELSGQSKMNRIRSIDIYICIVFILISFGLIANGMHNNSQSATVMGFFVGLFFVISFTIIQSKKMSNDWFEKAFPTIDEKLRADYNNIKTDFGTFFSDNSKILLGFLPLGGVIYAIILSFGYLLGFFAKGGILNSWYGFLYMLILTVYITVVLATIYKK
jgi:hypothetical protein